MSTKNPTGLQNAGTTDAPLVLEPTLTSVISEHPATDRPVAYDYHVWATIVTCSTDTVRLVVEEDR